MRRLVFVFVWLVFVRAAVPPVDAFATEPPATVRETLGNGLQVIIVPDRLAPVVTTELVYRAGSNDAPPGFPGTAHALEHMMFRGSTGLDKDQLYEIGAQLGGLYNASTTETDTRYTFTVPKDDLSLVLQIEALRMAGATLAEPEWQQERGAIEQEVSADLSNPFYAYLAQVRSMLFAGSPYAHDALGTRPSFDQTDVALLRRFYETWYAPNNAILIIVGDIDPAMALAAVHAAFDAIPSREVPAHATAQAGPVTPTSLHLPTNFATGLVAIAVRMPGRADPDFAAADVLSDVLASRRYALYGLVPTGKALAARFSYQAQQGAGIGIAYAAFPTGDDPQPVLEALQAVLTDAATHGVPAELVEAAKQAERAELAASASSITGLARLWSEAVAVAGVSSPADLGQAYASVTPDDVNRVAATLLGSSRRVLAVLTPTDASKAGAFGGGFGGAESFARPPDHPVLLPAWAAARLRDLPQEATPPAPSVTTLANGMRLIVQPTHVSPTVQVSGRIRSESALEEPHGQEGVATLTERLFGQGTEQHDRLGFEAATDAIAAEISGGSDFQLDVPAASFEAGMKLLAEQELHPAFAEADVTRLRRQLAASLPGQFAAPTHAAARTLDRALLPEGDPDLREPSVASVAALTQSDVRAYYAHAYRPDLTTLVIVGDVTPEAAARVVDQTFGRWTASGPPPSIDLPPVPPNGPARERVPDPSRIQDSVVLAEMIGTPVTGHDRYPLMLGDSILGGGFSSRLYADLRVKTGIVYSVGSGADWSRTRARFSVQFGADPDKVDQARHIIVEDLQQMQRSRVSEDDLRRAKAQVLRQLAMQGASFSAIAGQYLRLVDLGLPLDAAAIAAARYRTITAEDIRQAFDSWVRPEDLVEIVRGPPSVR